MLRNVDSGIVQFRDFRPSDESEVVTLLSTGRRPGFFTLKEKLFQWQFLENPHSRGRSPFLIGELEGEIVALGGLMPARARFHGRPIDATWSVDVYVSPEHRGQGIGRQLLAGVSEAAPLMLCYGISDMSDPIYDKLSWAKHPGVDLSFFHLAERGLKGQLKNAASRVASLRSLRIAGTDCEIWDDLTAQDMIELDDLWDRNVADYPTTIERDAAYLRWKYFEHPVFEYRAYALRKRGGLHAVLIVRDDAEESVIADYIGPANDEDAIANLAIDIIRDHHNRPTARIKCESTHKPLVAALRRVGFIGSQYTSRFRVRANRTNLDPLHGWFLMTGDSDGDLMASAAYLEQLGANRRSGVA